MSDSTPKPADPLAAAAASGPIESMATDNTPVGRIDDATVEAGPIASVTAGMNVVDGAGQEVGKVREVRMGDPSAATDSSEIKTESNTFLNVIVDALFGEDSEIPESARHELIRTGFIEIDGKGWFGHDYVASPSQLARVDGDTVTLTVPKEDLIRV